ncbi:sensor histidine kinase [Varunaivibrio sulfuroxidans]|nr:sensor histidine kinase [Varunaivibrio sulfuroxidans]WES30544.1 sensor histidine kinase [Varunaivibrio sulfuroxidans]
MNGEIETVKEKHLLLAQNLTQSLGRYVKDVRLVFALAAQNLDFSGPPAGIEKTLRGLRVRSVREVDRSGRLVRSICGFNCSRGDGFSAAVFRTLTKARARAKAVPGRVVLSNIFRNAQGEPTVFLLMAKPGERVVIGELATDHMISLQHLISFGGRGHAVIVDRVGRVIAHPYPSFVAEMKSLSALNIVQEMMRGKSGVGIFYSPHSKEKMIAGFAVVPGVGWGVMVPQPYAELEAKARALRWAVYAIAALGVLMSIAISWGMSGLLSRPLRAVVRTTDRIARGALSSRVEALPRFSPREVIRLAASFNHMMDEIHANTIKLAALTKKANAANRAKSNFLAGVSHELRTPLNAILGFSDAIRNQIFGPMGNPRYVDYVENIHGSGAHLLSLVDDLMDISCLEIGQLKLEERTVLIPDLVRPTLEHARAAAADKEIRIETAIAPDIPALHCDERRVRQILTVLLAHGVLRSPEGGTVRLNVMFDQGDRVRFSVADEGRELHPGEADSLLLPFYLADNGVARGQGGTGLGLSLSKALMESHGGTLRIASSTAAGLVVEIIFPAQRTVDIAEVETGA